MRLDSFIAPERVVALTGDHDVVTRGAAKHDVVFARVAEIVWVGLVEKWRRSVVRGDGVVADHERVERIIAERIGIAEMPVGSNDVVSVSLDAVWTCLRSAQCVLLQADRPRE